MSIRLINMTKSAGDLLRVLGQVAKEKILLAGSQMEKSLQALSGTVGISEKRCDLKIVGKPCEGIRLRRMMRGCRVGLASTPATYSTSFSKPKPCLILPRVGHFCLLAIPKFPCIPTRGYYI